jgi:glucosamine-6-phosphate deaminase
MHLLRFDTAEAWAANAASLWRDRLRRHPGLRLCLASGHTPIPIYRELVQSVQQHQVSFGQASIFALDEFGGLSPNDPGLCKNMLRRDLVDHIDVPAKSFYYFNPDAGDLEAQCREYDRMIRPGFDLVILGIGLNGHLGMNEPGSGPESPTRRAELHESTVSASTRYLNHQQLPRWGLTVGMNQFFAAKEVWLLATGQAKVAIVERIVKGEITDQVPASLMRQHSNCLLMVDAAAGAFY